jgi:ABC-type Fe3+-hydroxamate transport system substrate-binding protein
MLKMCQFSPIQPMDYDRAANSDVLFVASCRSLQHFTTPLVFTDQTGRSLHVAQTPKRIVSCVPSQTELLADLGMDNRVVGITKFCVHPTEWRKEKTIIGGTKNLNLEKIARLTPDFILANKEENDQSQIEWLASRFPTYVSDIRNLNQAIEMIQEVGRITSCIDQSTRITGTIESIFQPIESSGRTPSACYLIWKNPWMTINHDTFIHDMLCRQGFTNVFADRHDSRYPIIDESELCEANPEILFLSSEPFPFNARHLNELQLLLPTTRIYLLNGELLSWYGSRLCHFEERLFDAIRKQQ